MAELVGAVAGIVAAIVAAVALAVAIHANQIAQRSNGHAQTANGTAADALRQAQEANGIAEEANQLAGDSNAIAERALRVSQDDVPYKWVFQIDDNGSARIVNDCGHRAAQVTVMIDRAGNVVVDDGGGPIDMEPFDEMLFDLNGAMEQHFEIVRQNPVTKPWSGGGVVSAGSDGKSVETRFRAHLRWFTEQNVPRADVVEEVVRHRMTFDGIRRLRPRG